MKDEDDVDLEAIADAADLCAAEHDEHNCPISPLLRQASGILRSVAATSRGPAQVATEMYRSNWDGIFGGKQPVGQA